MRIHEKNIVKKPYRDFMFATFYGEVIGYLE